MPCVHMKRGADKCSLLLMLLVFYLFVFSHCFCFIIVVILCVWCDSGSHYVSAPYEYYLTLHYITFSFTVNTVMFFKNKMSNYRMTCPGTEESCCHHVWGWQAEWWVHGQLSLWAGKGMESELAQILPAVSAKNWRCVSDFHGCLKLSSLSISVLLSSQHILVTAR